MAIASPALEKRYPMQFHTKDKPATYAVTYRGGETVRFTNRKDALQYAARLREQGIRAVVREL